MPSGPHGGIGGPCGSLEKSGRQVSGGITGLPLVMGTGIGTHGIVAVVVLVVVLVVLLVWLKATPLTPTTAAPAASTTRTLFMCASADLGWYPGISHRGRVRVRRVTTL